MDKADLAIADLFDLPPQSQDEKPRHDPGGKVKTALPVGMIGKAEFYGNNDQYRLWLMRSWSHEGANVLWVGMNPSVATADVNDPTITREINFTKSWGFGTLFKVNVMDFRATYPKDLLAPGVIPCSDRNMETIVWMAKDAERIICAWGVITKKLQRHPDAVRKALLDAGYRNKMFCFGKTLLGHPRHPLYLSNDSKLESYS